MEGDSAEWQWLDAKVPEDHPARLVDRLVDDLLDLGPLWASYAGRGSRAHRPDLLLKLLIYEHHMGNPQPIQWHRDLAESIPAQWLVRGAPVSLSTLYEFRDRVEPFLEEWHASLVGVALDEEITDGKEGALDGTFVAANTSRHKLLCLDQIAKRLEQLDEVAAKEAANAMTPDDPPEPVDPSELPAWMGKSQQGRQDQRRRYQQSQEILGPRVEANGRRRSDKRKRPDQIRISPGDPEAVLGYDKLKTYRPLYNVQVMSDPSSHLILTYVVEPSLSDGPSLVPMIKRTEAVTGVRPEAVTADASYATGENLEGCRDLGVTLFAPWKENSFTQQKRNDKRQIPKEEFVWDADAQQYVCPEGKGLPFSHRTTKQRNDGSPIEVSIYQADPADCGACPCKQRCTKAEARMVNRLPYEELIEEHRQRMQTDEAKAMTSKRGSSVERSFADLKTWRGMERLSGRGLVRAYVQTGLSVLTHNLRVLGRAFQQRPMTQNQGKQAA